MEDKSNKSRKNKKEIEEERLKQLKDIKSKFQCQTKKGQQQCFSRKYTLVMQKSENFRIIKNNLSLVYRIYLQVIKLGGTIEISSEGNWGLLFENLTKEILLQSFSTEQDLPKVCKKFILPYELYQSNLSKNKLQSPNYQPSLQQTRFIYEEQFEEYCNSLAMGLTIYEQSATLIRNGQKVIGIDKSVVNLDQVAEVYGDEKIDIRIQKPCDYGFIVEKLKNQGFQMTISQYRQYQKIYNTEEIKGYKFYDLIKQGQIFFGVNFDPPEETVPNITEKLFRCIEKRFLGYKQQFDLLSYMDTDVPGCSFPQFYFKVKGCWTGGHSQNINMCAVNMNHGPDYSEWYLIDYQNVQNFRNLIKQKFHTDIYLTEGLWYENIDWFLEQGIKIKRILQKQGDIVVLGPGTLHWVRSFGIALQSAWNVMPKSLTQIKIAIKRHKENKKIHFPRHNTIPLKAILLRYLNHEHHTMQTQILNELWQTLTGWLKKQEQIVKKLFLKSDTITHLQNYLYDNESYCSVCKDEVLIYYVFSPNLHNNTIICLQCINAKTQLISKTKIIHHKFSPYFMQKLLDICADNKKRKQQIEIRQLCKGQNIGIIPCHNKLIEIPLYDEIDQKQYENIFAEFSEKLNDQINRTYQNLKEDQNIDKTTEISECRQKQNKIKLSHSFFRQEKQTYKNNTNRQTYKGPYSKYQQREGWKKRGTNFRRGPQNVNHYRQNRDNYNRQSQESESNLRKPNTRNQMYYYNYEESNPQPVVIRKG